MKKSLYSDKFLSLSYAIHGGIGAKIIFVLNFVISIFLFFIENEIGILYLIISILIYAVNNCVWKKKKVEK